MSLNVFRYRGLSSIRNQLKFKSGFSHGSQSSVFNGVIIRNVSK